MHRRAAAVAAWAVVGALLGIAPAVRSAAGEPVDVQVDARDLPRKLVRARATFRVQPGSRTFLYPKWMPGTHSPMGPVQNLGGLVFETEDGKAVPWRRDETDPYRFTCEVPRGSERLVVRTQYICNQATANSEGADCFGNALIGILNWNALLLYPEGSRIADLPIRLELLLPEGWKFGTALAVGDRKGDSVRFEQVPFERLVDSPLVAGRHFRSFPLTPEGAAVPHVLDVVSESETALQLPDELVARYRRVVAEAGAMFGRYPFESFHFLLTLSDQVGSTGLEHASSSLNGVKERALSDVEKIEPWVAYLLPHEYVHAWCGKWRRPEGMMTTDYHQPERTSLLWIYEGLTQYLGNVLAVRAGLTKPDEYRAERVASIASAMSQKGRTWRSLEDTAIDGWQLRSGSPSWGLHRRSQDYYSEGSLVWMEVDLIIRKGTDGRLNLDDFCRAFLGAESPGREAFPYSLDDVVKALSAIQPHDWRGLFASRVESTQDELPLDFVKLLGYRLQYVPERSKQRKDSETEGKRRDFTDSVGLSVREGGAISRVVPGSPADRAKLYEGVQVIGVAGRTFSLQRMEDAVAGSIAARGIKLLVAEADVLRDVELDYADGLKYLDIARDESQPDRLAAIMAPRLKEAAASKAPDQAGAAKP